MPTPFAGPAARTLGGTLRGQLNDPYQGQERAGCAGNRRAVSPVSGSQGPRNSALTVVGVRAVGGQSEPGEGAWDCRFFV